MRPEPSRLGRESRGRRIVVSLWRVFEPIEARHLTVLEVFEPIVLFGRLRGFCWMKLRVLDPEEDIEVGDTVHHEDGTLWIYPGTVFALRFPIVGPPVRAWGLGDEEGEDSTT